MTGTIRIERIAVVVPARNEERLLPRCLDALSRAVTAVGSVGDPCPPGVSVVIVLDRCTDSSAEVAAGFPKFVAIRTNLGAVGSARRAGVREVVPARHRTRHTWIATTDADSAVPENWLTTQLTFARNGVDLVLGTVRPDECLAAADQERWLAQHELVEGHPHVHGANLGVRADRYFAAGEFARTDAHEDVRLVGALRELRVREISTARIAVLTSGRLAGRAPSGFAGFLRAHVNAAPDSAASNRTAENSAAESGAAENSEGFVTTGG
ncbi:glycosyltransferase family 2 protein [Cryobacterium sp. HLT2-28]|uniref:glycosyltransferase n=1 Tax=Cryobacterium sp. HLT2-28 TaxID=1259146 RepID=UPI001F5443FE|nr:glycosyltransferase family A protein [Cryobacterium sp. HLT2-28]